MPSVTPGRCFGYIKDWVAKKVRRHMMQARKRTGFGWGRWSKQRIYETLGLFNGYQIRYFVPKVLPAGKVSLPMARSEQLDEVVR